MLLAVLNAAKINNRFVGILEIYIANSRQSHQVQRIYKTGFENI